MTIPHSLNSRHTAGWPIRRSLGFPTGVLPVFQHKVIIEIERRSTGALSPPYCFLPRLLSYISWGILSAERHKEIVTYDLSGLNTGFRTPAMSLNGRLEYNSCSEGVRVVFNACPGGYLK